MGCELYVSEVTKYSLQPWGPVLTASLQASPPHRRQGAEAEHSLGCSEQQASGFGSLVGISLASAGGAALGGHSALLPFSVLDVNDENPTFFPAVYNVSLPENVARDFKVVRLNCTDADIGLNAELSYFITGMNPLQSAAKGSFPCRKEPGSPQTLARVFCTSALPFPAPPKLVRYRPLPNSPAWLPALLTAPPLFLVPLGVNPCPRASLAISHHRDAARKKQEDGLNTAGAVFV